MGGYNTSVWLLIHPVKLSIILTFFLQKTSCVRLGAVAELAVEVVENAGLNSSLPSDYNESIRIILEGLLAHFFSPERQCYNSEDIRWFLNLANSQRGGEDGQVERIFVIDKKEVGLMVIADHLHVLFMYL